MQVGRRQGTLHLLSQGGGGHFQAKGGGGGGGGGGGALQKIQVTHFCIQNLSLQYRKWYIF